MVPQAGHRRGQRRSSKIWKTFLARGLILLGVMHVVRSMSSRSAKLKLLECGYPGITRVDCELLGCQFNTDRSCSTLELSKPTYYTCNVDYSTRSNCGYPSITEKSCIALQCCFQSSECYFPGAIVPSISSPTEQQLKPLFSIIVTCYGNDSDYLPNALRSVILQSYSRWEALVVDDGSPLRRCMEVANSFINGLPKQDAKKFRTYYKENGFIADARNYGIERAQGTFILPVDADDYLGPTFLFEAERALQHDSDLELLYADQYFFGVKTSAPHWFLWKNMRLKSALQRGPLPVTTVYTKNLWLRVGGYKLDMIFGNEDYNFWLEVLSTFPKYRKLPSISSWYRQKASSMHEDLEYKKLGLPMLRTHQAFFFSEQQVSADLATIFCYLHNSNNTHRLDFAMSKQPESCPAWLWSALQQLSLGHTKRAKLLSERGLALCHQDMKSHRVREYMTIITTLDVETKSFRSNLLCRDFSSECSLCEQIFQRHFKIL